MQANTCWYAVPEPGAAAELRRGPRSPYQVLVGALDLIVRRMTVAVFCARPQGNHTDQHWDVGLGNRLPGPLHRLHLHWPSHRHVRLGKACLPSPQRRSPCPWSRAPWPRTAWRSRQRSTAWWTPLSRCAMRQRRCDRRERLEAGQFSEDEISSQGSWGCSRAALFRARLQRRVGQGACLRSASPSTRSYPAALALPQGAGRVARLQWVAGLGAMAYRSTRAASGVPLEVRQGCRGDPQCTAHVL